MKRRSRLCQTEGGGGRSDSSLSLFTHKKHSFLFYFFLKPSIRHSHPRHAVICQLWGGETGALAFFFSFLTQLFQSLFMCTTESAILWNPCRKDWKCALLSVPLSITDGFSLHLPVWHNLTLSLRVELDTHQADCWYTWMWRSLFSITVMDRFPQASVSCTIYAAAIDCNLTWPWPGEKKVINKKIKNPPTHCDFFNKQMLNQKRQCQQLTPRRL